MLEFNNGPEPEILAYNDGRPLCDGAWHSVFVSKDRLAGSVSVDNNDLQTVVSSCDTCQDFMATNTDSPLYVGGLPGNANIIPTTDFHYCVLYVASVQSRYNIFGGSFEGCLSNLYIQQENRNRQSLLFSQAIQHENVQF